MYGIVNCLMVVDGEVKICLMMYFVLFYDYWVIDGSIFVIFFVRVKELLENFNLFLFDV